METHDFLVVHFHDNESSNTVATFELVENVFRLSEEFHLPKVGFASVNVE